MNWFLSLDEEDQNFIKQMILASGSLKALAKLYQVSYPTVRARLDRVIQKIQLLEQTQTSSFETKMMQRVIEEKLPFELAKEIIEDFKDSQNSKEEKND